MTLAEIFETLENAGFITTVNETHTEVTVGLKNRPVNTMEVEHALQFEVDRNRMNRNGDSVVVR